MSDGCVMPSAVVIPELLPIEICLVPVNFCFIL